MRPRHICPPVSGLEVVPAVIGPNFFVIGAPKCGTSALAEYLRQHPQCFMCLPKEPLFFCEDLPGIRQVDNLKQYQRLFAAAPPHVRATGEASAMYLYSRLAVPRLLEHYPPARVIVMLRNPIDLVQAFHAQMCYSLAEDQSSLAIAWALQEARARGTHLPPTCPEPKLLQYREIARLGEQMQRILGVLPSKSVHVVIFDDLVRNPRAEYLRVLDFLGLNDDGRLDFPAVNARRAHRVRLLSQLTQRPPRGVLGAWNAFKRAFGIERVGILDWLRDLNSVPIGRPQLPAELRREMAASFAEDVELLSALLRRDFTAWTSKASGDAAPCGANAEEA